MFISKNYKRILVQILKKQLSNVFYGGPLVENILIRFLNLNNSVLVLYSKNVFLILTFQKIKQNLYNYIYCDYSFGIISLETCQRWKWLLSWVWAWSWRWVWTWSWSWVWSWSVSWMWTWSVCRLWVWRDVCLQESVKSSSFLCVYFNTKSSTTVLSKRDNMWPITISQADKLKKLCNLKMQLDKDNNNLTVKQANSRLVILEDKSISKSVCPATGGSILIISDTTSSPLNNKNILIHYYLYSN